MKPLLVIVFSLLFSFTYAQENTDSLWSVWNDLSQDDTTRIKAFQSYTWYGFLYSDPDSAFVLAQQSFEFAEARGLSKYMGWALLGQGVALKYIGNNSKALSFYLESLKYFEEAGDQVGVAGVLNNIGIMYYEQGDYQEALVYHESCLALRLSINDTKGEAASYTNLANLHKAAGEYDLALDYHFKSLHIKKNEDWLAEIATELDYIGNIYYLESDYEKALAYFEKGLSMSEVLKEYFLHSTLHVHLGMTFFQLEESQMATDYCNEALAIAERINNPEEQIKACDCLYEVYKAQGKSKDALQFFEKSRFLEDSLNSVKTAKELQAMEFNKRLLNDSIQQVERERIKQLEFDEEIRQTNRTRNILIITGVFILLIAAGLYSRLIYIRKAKNLIEKEKDRSESLLLNILPQEVAQELKEKGQSEAKDYENVTVLFTDFEDFTHTAESLTAKDLVDEINTCFKVFDDIIQRYQIEKIKTIGDAYMAAGGLHVPRTSEPLDVVSAAIEMQEFMIKHKEKRQKQDLPFFNMRVGIHTGPVVAGIVGVKKFQYDIWGDTVNTASRMESYGEIGKVNISNTTYERIMENKQLRFESRGQISVKGKGEMKMWFVDSL